MQTLRYGKEQLQFQVNFMPSRKGSVAIHVHPDGTVQVDAPANTEMAQIKRAVGKRARWILGHLEKSERRREFVLSRQYISGEGHLYLGRRYVLKVHRNNQATPGVKLVRGQLVVTTKHVAPAVIKELLLGWYWRHARQYFADRIGILSSTTPWVAEVPRWSLRTMSKQWGSCSPRGMLSFNPHLVKAPRVCIEYVLLHELCHLQEHNHSRRFYHLLDGLMPEWRTVKAKLDGMAEIVLNG